MAAHLDERIWRTLEYRPAPKSVLRIRLSLLTSCDKLYVGSIQIIHKSGEGISEYVQFLESRLDRSRHATPA
jgi:hypothetical protein